MLRPVVVVLLVVVGLGVTAGCGEDLGAPSGDETGDFATTTAKAPADNPYFRYVDLARAAGVDPEPASVVERRAAEACFDDLSATEALERGDRLVVAAFCPRYLAG